MLGIRSELEFETEFGFEFIAKFVFSVFIWFNVRWLLFVEELYEFPVFEVFEWFEIVDPPFLSFNELIPFILRCPGFPGLALEPLRFDGVPNELELH